MFGRNRRELEDEQRLYDCGDFVLDTDGAHWVDAVAESPEARTRRQRHETDLLGLSVVPASAVSPTAPGVAPDGPTGAGIDQAPDVNLDAYDQSPYPAPEGYVTLRDFPWTVRAPRE